MTSRLQNIVAAVLLCCLASRVGAESTLVSFEGLVSQWINLRSTIAAERREWQEQKQHLEDELALLTREQAMLQAHLAAADAELTPLEEDRAELKARVDKMEATLRELQPSIGRAEQDLREWMAIIPAGTAGSVHEAFKRLPPDSASADTIPVTRRVQLVVALYTEIEKLQHGYHNSKEVLVTTNGQRAEVDVLYLGLSRAYAVSPSGDWAAVGKPTREGWTWVATPRIASAVRHALGVLRKEEMADFSTLPVDIPLAMGEGVAP